MELEIETNAVACRLAIGTDEVFGVPRSKVCALGILQNQSKAVPILARSGTWPAILRVWYRQQRRDARELFKLKGSLDRPIQDELVEQRENNAQGQPASGKAHGKFVSHSRDLDWW